MCQGVGGVMVRQNSAPSIKVCGVENTCTHDSAHSREKQMSGTVCAGLPADLWESNFNLKL